MKYAWYSFLLEAEPTSGPQCGRKDYVNEKSGIEPATFQLQCFNQLRHQVPIQKVAALFSGSKVTEALN
jgi:hypothetical protein